ncbi:MAG: 50S ribosomal protein L15 [Acidobacteriota bacterium]
MKLHDLRPAPGAHRDAKRVGRGMGSGRGKTSGRGEKGQKSRRGYSRKRGFEGGQMPLHRRLPKRGFRNIFRVEYSEVNLARLAGLAAGTEIDPDFMRAHGLASHRSRPVKILGQGTITVPLIVTAHRFSASAVRKLEEAGGKAVVIPARPRGPKPRPARGKTAKDEVPASAVSPASAANVAPSDRGESA